MTEQKPEAIKLTREEKIALALERQFARGDHIRPETPTSAQYEPTDAHERK